MNSYQHWLLTFLLNSLWKAPLIALAAISRGTPHGSGKLARPASALHRSASARCPAARMERLNLNCQSPAKASPSVFSPATSTMVYRTRPLATRSRHATTAVRSTSRQLFQILSPSFIWPSCSARLGSFCGSGALRRNSFAMPHLRSCPPIYPANGAAGSNPSTSATSICSYRSKSPVPSRSASATRR